MRLLKQSIITVDQGSVEADFDSKDDEEKEQMDDNEEMEDEDAVGGWRIDIKEYTKAAGLIVRYIRSNDAGKGVQQKEIEKFVMNDWYQDKLFSTTEDMR